MTHLIAHPASTDQSASNDLFRYIYIYININLYVYTCFIYSLSNETCTSPSDIQTRIFCFLQLVVCAMCANFSNGQSLAPQISNIRISNLSTATRMDIFRMVYRLTELSVSDCKCIEVHHPRDLAGQLGHSLYALALSFAPSMTPRYNRYQLPLVPSFRTLECETTAPSLWTNWEKRNTFFTNLFYLNILL